MFSRGHAPSHCIQFFPTPAALTTFDSSKQLHKYLSLIDELVLSFFVIADVDGYSDIPASALTKDLPDRLLNFTNIWHRSRN